ncbi:MAG: hypothetical protein JWO03_2847 [Bacteroidetes bacterium]|nr:hypothetical protein [Bacteroidota bacterium]
MDIWQKAIHFFKGLGVLRGVVFCIVCILVLTYLVSTSIKGGDFVTFLEAADKMWHGKNIYDPPYINLRYSYSPFWAMVLVPFALLPDGLGAFIWLILSLILLWRTIYLLRTRFCVSMPDKGSNVILWFLILLYISRYIELNFHHVQMTIFLLWMILESILLAENNKEMMAGILIGVGAIIKIMPIVMVPYFLYRRRFIAALSSCITIGVCFFLPIFFVGKERFSELNQSWFSILRPDSPEFQVDATWHFPQNLSALLYRLFVDTGAPYSRNVVSLSYPQAELWIWIVIGGLVLMTIYFLNSMPFQRSKSKLHQLYEVSYITLLIPLIFPHQMKYAFYFVFPAICCLCLVIVTNYQGQKRSIKYLSTVCLVFISFILCTATTDLIIGMKYSTISQHLKTITIGTLLLIPALAINRSFFSARGGILDKPND